MNLEESVKKLERNIAVSKDILEYENKEDLCKMHFLFQKYSEWAGIEICFK